MREAEQLGSQRQTVIQAHAQGGLHAAAFIPGFFLCHRCLKRQRHVRGFIEREDVLGFKEHANRRIVLRQHSNHAQKVHHVAGKTGYALGDDEINLARLAFGDHAVELIHVLGGGTADALVSVYVDQCPFGVPHDEVLVILLLKLIRSCLARIIRGNSDICNVISMLEKVRCLE